MAKLVGKCNGLPGQAQQCSTAHFKPKLTNPGLGETLQQIMAALNSGNGQGGRDGYGLFNEDVALYGPNVELAGEQAGDRGETGSNGMPPAAVLARDAADAEPPLNEPPGHVKLQPDTKFPLRYRELVGEYFRVMAETGKEGDQ